MNEQANAATLGSGITLVVDDHDGSGPLSDTTGRSLRAMPSVHRTSWALDILGQQAPAEVLAVGRARVEYPVTSAQDLAGLVGCEDSADVHDRLRTLIALADERARVPYEPPSTADLERVARETTTVARDLWDRLSAAQARRAEAIVALDRYSPLPPRSVYMPLDMPFSTYMTIRARNKDRPVAHDPKAFEHAVAANTEIRQLEPLSAKAFEARQVALGDLMSRYGEDGIAVADALARISDLTGMTVRLLRKVRRDLIAADVRLSTARWQRVERGLRDALEDPAWPPDNTDGRLPSEWTLAGQYNVDRSSVTRALRALANDGLIESVHGVGWFRRGAHVVAQGLREALTDPTWPPGGRLPTPEDLAVRYDMLLADVLAGLDELGAEGVIEFRDGAWWRPAAPGLER